ncbi:glycosyltransferase family 4 protein [Halogranum rubrum]|uniref:Glycosyltransferase n=1 Tax=Halogranum salarium B-1 TaxID=1210908 RepID=J3JDW8_9EURY|nr:glycosyltransferase family 4 protein [Halogranum salarium]EJN57851.1 hypothetical protein HSB1_32680 [Halogranum salarium B-1]
MAIQRPRNRDESTFGASVEGPSSATSVESSEAADEVLADLDIAMLYFDPHPAHRGFASAIGADLVHYREHSAGPFSGTIVEDVVNGLQLPDYDVCLVEGSVPLYAALVGRAMTDTDVVYLCADHGLYHVGQDDFRGSSAVKSLIGRFGVPAIKHAANWGIDGVMAVSEFAASFASDIVGDETPIRVAHPYVQPDVYADLQTCEPVLDRNVAVAVGRDERYKGFDMLVDAWTDVRAHHPDAELHVVGSDQPRAYEATDGVTVHGYVEDLTDAFAGASLYVQPSRMDTFPVSTLEGMCAGLPPLVTTTTGTASEARAIDESLVVDPTPDALAAGVSRYFDRSNDERRTYSAHARRRGQTFDRVSRQAAFHRTFADLVTALD